MCVCVCVCTKPVQQILLSTFRHDSLGLLYISSFYIGHRGKYSYKYCYYINVYYCSYLLLLMFIVGDDFNIGRSSDDEEDGNI